MKHCEIANPLLCFFSSHAGYQESTKAFLREVASRVRTSILAILHEYWDKENEYVIFNPGQGPSVVDSV